MARSGPEDHLNAVLCAAAAVGHATGKQLVRPIPLYDVSLILKYLLLERIERELPELRPGVIEAKTAHGFDSIYSIACDLWENELDGVLDRIQKELCPELDAETRQTIRTQPFRHRIALLVWEQLLGERSAPELRISPKPISDNEQEELLGERPVVLIVFESFPNVVNECFPLLVDGLVYNLDTFGRVRWLVGLAHVSWLDARCRPDRLILYNTIKNQLIETDVQPPPSLGALLALCMSPRAHRRVSFLANDNQILELNPYARSAEWADSKIVAYDLWRERHVPTPRSGLILKGSDIDEIASRLRAFCMDAPRKLDEPELYSFQPNSGTEGHGVDRWIVNMDEQPDWHNIAEEIAPLISSDDVLIREVVGNVRFYPPESIKGRTCDLRINVTFDGTDYHAESGYLQVAGDEENWISSTGRGGLICKFSRGALTKLRDPGGNTVNIDFNTMMDLSDIAVSAAKVFPGLSLVGVDLKLEVEAGGQVEAYVLDANPRPAGLTHSEFLPLKTPGTEPGVTRHIWRRISTL